MVAAGPGEAGAEPGQAGAEPGEAGTEPDYFVAAELPFQVMKMCGTSTQAVVIRVCGGAEYH